MTNLQTSLDAKAATSHTHTEYAPTSHTHTIANVTNLQTSLDAKAATSHTHTEYAPTSHTHTIANVTGLQVALDAKVGQDHTHNQYADFTHQHQISNIFNLRAELDGKAATSHAHNWTQITAKPDWTTNFSFENVGPFISPPEASNFDVVISNSLTPSVSSTYNIGQRGRRYNVVHSDFVNCHEIFFDDFNPFSGSYNELRDRPSTSIKMENITGLMTELDDIQTTLQELQTKLNAKLVYDELLIYYSNVNAKLGMGNLIRTCVSNNIAGKVENTLSIQLKEYIIPVLEGVTVLGASMQYRVYGIATNPELWGPPVSEGIIPLQISSLTTSLPVSKSWTFIKQDNDWVINPKHDSNTDIVRIILYVVVSTPLTPTHDIICFYDTLSNIQIGNKRHIVNNTFHR